MQQAAQKRGISLTSRSRPLTPQDLTHFDHIIGTHSCLCRRALRWAVCVYEHAACLCTIVYLIGAWSKQAWTRKTCSRSGLLPNTGDPSVRTSRPATVKRQALSLHMQYQTWHSESMFTERCAGEADDRLFARSKVCKVQARSRCSSKPCCTRSTYSRSLCRTCSCW